jgi:Lipase (class 3)
MALNRTAAAYLAYIAYADDALATVKPSDFQNLLRAVPANVPNGSANGPWNLRWGPAVNEGTLAYVAQGADGTYALAFRGTDVDGSILGAFENVVEDADGLALVPWLYPQTPGAPLQISAGLNQALAFAIGLTDPATDLSLLDYLRGLAQSGPLDLMVAGHSLGAALAVAATAWLNDQLPRVGPANFSLWPHTFAAPTMWNGPFATMFAQTFQYYAGVNAYDVVPMGWANLSAVLPTYPSPGPSLQNTNWVLYDAIYYLNESGALAPYQEIQASFLDRFTPSLIATDSWTDEAGAMHSMQFIYFPDATGTVAPPLPGTTRTGFARPRIAAPA